ncbi:MAG: hypothetical protein ACRDQW_05895 [Haloechinothrix sp.]
MSGAQKAGIAALVAVVVLFVVAVVLSAGSEQGDASAEQDGALGTLLDRFGDPAAAGPRELSGSCLQPTGTLLVQGSCALLVAPSEQRMRLVRLRAGEQSITVSAPAPEDADFTVRKRVKPGEEVGVAVDSGGAVISLRCQGFGRLCEPELVQGGGS